METLVQPFLPARLISAPFSSSNLATFNAMLPEGLAEKCIGKVPFAVTLATGKYRFTVLPDGLYQSLF
jgi:hypothetical protein